MTQVTWRAPDELVERVRVAAALRDMSVNEYLTSLARAATDHDLADDSLQQLRERLAHAGLLAPPGTPRSRPAQDRVAEARRRTSGTSLADLVSDGRG